MNDEIKYSQVIVTCEACGEVKRFDVSNKAECDRIFQSFNCQNKCGRNLYSIITVGTIDRGAPPQ